MMGPLISPLLALAFGSAWMLLWGLAAAIPIVFHYWNRRQHAEVDWAAMHFLMTAIEKKSRRIRFDRLLLLLTRIGVLLLFALALADPYFPSQATTASSPPKTLTVLVFDVSYSMNAKHGDTTLLDGAKEHAKQLVRDSRLGDLFTIVTISQPSGSIVEIPSADKVLLAESIDQIEIADLGADLGGCLHLLGETFRDTKENYPEFAHRVCFYSDLATNTWDATVRDTAKQQQVGNQLEQISKQAEIVVVSQGFVGDDNAAVTALRCSNEIARISETISFEADTEFFNRREDLTATLLIDGQAVASTTASKDSTTVRFDFQFDRAGEFAVEVRLSDDSLASDNHRYKVISCIDSLKVLVFEQKTSAGALLAAAIAPTSISPSNDGTKSGFQVDIDRSMNLYSVGDLQEYDAIILPDVAAFSTIESGLLTEFLRNGGGLVVSTGPSTEAELESLVDAEFLPARLLGCSDGTQRFDPRDYKTSIVRPFKNVERSGLKTTAIWRRCLTIPNEKAVVCLWYNNGDAAIITEKKGRGVTVLLTTDAALPNNSTVGNPTSAEVDSSPWSALPFSASFPPLVHNMLLESVQGRYGRSEYLVGNAWTEALEVNPEHTVRIAHSDSEKLFEYRLQTNEFGSANLNYPNCLQRGIYRLSTPNGESLRQLAVNLDTSESAPNRITREQLPTFMQASEFAARPKLTTPARRSKWLFAMIVLGLLFLLLMESLLAWLLGGRA